MRLVLADDHSVVREGLKAILSAEHDLQVVAAEADGQAALEAIRAHRPEVAVLDVQMPLISGFEVARRVKAEGLRTAVVILSLHKEELDVQSAVSAGVLGYVIKDDATAEVVAAIRAAARGEFWLSPRLAGTVVHALRNPRAQGIEQLTPRERQVLALLSRGLRSKEIAAELALSLKTVEGHRAALMDKLEIRSVAGLVKFAIRNHLAEL